MSFREYVKKYGKYPFNLLDKEGKEVKLLLTETEHQNLMDHMELCTDIIQHQIELDILYGIKVKIEWEKIIDEKGLQELHEQLEEMLK